MLMQGWDSNTDVCTVPPKPPTFPPSLSPNTQERAKSLSSGGLQSNSPLLGASGTGWGQLRLSYAHHIVSSPHKQAGRQSGDV